MPIPDAKTGQLVKVSKRAVPFSYWPTITNSGRHKTQPMLFVHDPWGALETHAHTSYSEPAYSVAMSFLKQAKEYFNSGKTASSIESKPLLFYYSFLNLLKFCALERSSSMATMKVQHGLALDGLSSSITNASLSAHASSTKSLNAFDELLELVGVDRVCRAGEVISVDELMESQIIGHRLWCEAKGRNEHFVAIDKLQLFHDINSRELWIRLYITSSDLSQAGKRPLAALRGSGLEELGWHRVGSPYASFCFEMRTPLVYRQRASDYLNDLCSGLKSHLYRLIGSGKPYRRYYLHLARPNRDFGQLPSTYAMLFYLGSITRYRPKTFIDIMNGKYGGFIREQLAIQPDQMLYEFTCLAMKQEISKGALVSI